MMSYSGIFTKRLALLQQTDPINNPRSLQADPHLGAGDLQGTNGHVENISDLVSSFSPLDEIYDLLKPFRRKLYCLTTSGQGRAFLSLNCLLRGHGLTPH
jgi:hypothetical protein